MDRKEFLVVSGAAPLASLPASVGINDLRLLATVGRTNRIAVLSSVSTFAIIVADAGVTRTVNVPRPVSAEPRWSAVDPPATPIVNPYFRNDDVVFDAMPDDVTASIVYRTGIIFAFTPRIGRSYLVYVVPNASELMVFPLDRSRSVQALFLAPDGLHVVFGAGAELTIPLPR